MLWRRGTFLVPMGQAALVVAVLSGTLAGAQTFRGAINGTITDPAGAAVPGTQVQATDDATGIAHQTVASGAGDFSFPDLPLGSYTITVTTQGFDTLKITKVNVSAGAIHTVPVRLTVAQQATTIEVSGSSLALDTTTPVQTTTIPSKTVQDIPLNGRDFTQMIGLAPGFAGYSAGGY
ncbi:MAG TPA: carboxypeptidase-like regulatory domain-containing protein, partial [Acidobacteriaceae bacterium]|nr:carboxypeptidase-like regulatory domain-containing protein [Acidobacteriaceae bacterium]